MSNTRLFVLSSVTALVSLAAIANATSYCGYDSEASDSTIPASTTLPNGYPVGSTKQIPELGGLGDGGMAIRGNHRWCGQIAIYLYTGPNPSSYAYVDVDLNPSIVQYDVAQVKCTATLAKTETAYADAVDYPSDYWPNPAVVYLDAGYIDYSVNPPRRHVYIYAQGAYGLAANTTYTILAQCPTNMPD